MKRSETIKFLSIKAAYLVLATFIVSVVINLSWFDETLRPEIHAPQSQGLASSENNAYPLMYAFIAADDKDPLLVGRIILEAQADLYAQGKILSADQLESFIGGTGLDDEWRENYKSLSCVSRLSLNCAVNLAEELQRIGIADARLQILLSRYENIQRQQHFREYEELEAYLPIPSYTQLMNVSRINLALRFNDPDSQNLLDFVAKDLSFWKMLLTDGQLIVAKMVALAGIRNNLDYLSLAIRSGKFNNTQLESISDFLVPLTLEESDIGETFLADIRVALLSSESLEHAYGIATAFEKLWWQKNATINADYLNFVEPLQYVASLSANEFYVQQGFKKLTFSVPALPSSLYNLAGKMALRDTRGNYNLQDYIARVHDLNGMIYVVLLQTDLALNSNSSIEEFVNKSEYVNPYTLAPMTYDSGAGEVGIDCMSSNESDLCKVML